MKEKIKNLVKNRYFKIIVFILLWLFILRESYSVYIDMYNFKQLEKAKPYLETIDENTKDFYNIKQFNERYNAWIKPIKNCYDISNYNWKYPYIFWFKLESLIYIFIYKKSYFVYPGYDAPIQIFCGWGPECTEDVNRKIFERIISNPCEE